MGCPAVCLLAHLLSFLSLSCNSLIFGVNQNVMGPPRARGMFPSFNQEELALSFNWPQQSPYILSFYVVF